MCCGGCSVLSCSDKQLNFKLLTTVSCFNTPGGYSLHFTSSSPPLCGWKRGSGVLWASRGFFTKRISAGERRQKGLGKPEREEEKSRMSPECLQSWLLVGRNSILDAISSSVCKIIEIREVKKKKFASIFTTQFSC